MLAFLKNHPFAVEAFFESSLVLTFAAPKQDLQYLIPECLALDTFKDKWAFVAVAMVQTKGLRPKGFPAMLGNDFFLIGYRIFVRYTTSTGKRLRGLYILKSETDRKKMQLLGNTFTHYNYSTVDVSKVADDGFTTIQSKKAGFKIVTQEAGDTAALPTTSPFESWAEARRFAGPLPFTFMYNARTKKVLMIEGVRENWTPSPIHVVQHTIPFIQSLQLNNAVLANAFIINNIPYYWKKGREDQWTT